MHRLAIGHGRPNPRPSGTLDAVAIVRRLLDRKADPNARLKAAIFQRHHTMGDGSLGSGATPFMRAAKSGDVEVMKLLLEAGADPTLTLPNKSNALMFAAGLGWRDGSPAAPSYDQGTPDDAVQAITLLLERGFDLNAANDNGDTALHLAVTNRGAPEIVRFLIARGANLKAQNKRGLTPLAAAMASRKDLAPSPTSCAPPNRNEADRRVPPRAGDAGVVPFVDVRPGRARVRPVRRRRPPRA